MTSGGLAEILTVVFLLPLVVFCNIDTISNLESRASETLCIQTRHQSRKHHISLFLFLFLKLFNINKIEISTNY
jgi:hypothetical protein